MVIVEEMEQMEVREGETKTSKEVLPPQAPCTDAKGTTVVDTTVVDTTVVDTAVHTTDVGAFVSFHFCRNHYYEVVGVHSCQYWKEYSIRNYLWYWVTRI